MALDPRNRLRRGRQPPPDYLSGAVQRRLLTMLGSLVLVVLMMRVASRPESWGWIWRFADRPASVTPDTAGRSTPTPQPLGERRTSVPPGSVLAVTDDAAPPPQETAAAAPHTLSTGLDRQLLRDVTDDTYFRPQERDAWIHVLAWLQEADPATLAPTATQEVSSLQLLNQMPAYRGRLVCVRGLVRRAERLPTATRETELKARWRCWLQDAAGTAPIVIYCLELPAAFPLGADLREPTTFVGVAYKRWPYQAETGLLVAPVVLARTAIWTPQPPAPPPTRLTPRQLLLGILAATALSLLAVRFIYSSSLHPRRPSRKSELPDRLPRPTADAMGQRPLPAADDTDPDTSRAPVTEPRAEP